MLTHDIQLLQDVFTLHPYGAMFWRSKGWLLLSDLHLGKAAHFRKAGLPLPEGSDEETLTRMDEVIVHFQPKRTVIIGDLFHSAHNNAWEPFHAWCKRQTSELHLVLGNHDRLAERRYRLPWAASVSMSSAGTHTRAWCCMVKAISGCGCLVSSWGRRSPCCRLSAGGQGCTS
jgi:hypothetical protein